jgi:DMSO/TMAO reductase YedYZ molybdopterin-dependent catalytic subunit
MELWKSYSSALTNGEGVAHPGTPIEVKFTGHFARSMSIAVAHGAPLRLIAPGWFGVANVRWLRRIEVRDTRFLGRFMGRDYVTVREEQREGEMVVVETSVGRGLPGHRKQNDLINRQTTRHVQIGWRRALRARPGGHALVTQQ